jgi:hypothetical protein
MVKHWWEKTPMPFTAITWLATSAAFWFYTCLQIKKSVTTDIDYVKTKEALKSFWKVMPHSLINSSYHFSRRCYIIFKHPKVQEEFTYRYSIISHKTQSSFTTITVITSNLKKQALPYTFYKTVQQTCFKQFIMAHTIYSCMGLHIKGHLEYKKLCVGITKRTCLYKTEEWPCCQHTSVKLYCIWETSVPYC